MSPCTLLNYQLPDTTNVEGMVDTLRLDDTPRGSAGGYLPVVGELHHSIDCSYVRSNR